MPPLAETAVAGPQALPLMTRAYLWVVAGGALLVAALLVVTGDGSAASHQAAGLFALLALSSAVATRLPDAQVAATVTTVFGGVIATTGAATVLLGWGLQAPALPLFGLAVALASLAAGWRAGAWLAAASAATVLLIAVYAPGPDSGPDAPPATALLATHLAAIIAGLASGTLASRVMLRFAASAREREFRFRRLLTLAADAYWETDAALRVRAAPGENAALPRMTLATGLGRVFWELPQFGCDADTLDTMRADMEARRPFRDLPVRWTFATGRSHDFLSSGEPRFDESGNFTGYWGVVRDITAVQAAQQAQAATETRYEDLFWRIPTPLVLHRDGRVVDANPAALALFGHTDLEAMTGSALLLHYESGESRDRARQQLQQLLAQPAGAALPVAGFQLRVQGRRLSVRATTVCVETASDTALLTIYVDDSERLAAEEALRRSEALLAGVVATSPDLITLTDLKTGRYVMVNPCFERVTGWRADEVVGRTSIEVGIWASNAERQAVVDEVRQRGHAADLPLHCVTRDGRTIPLRVSAAHVGMAGCDYLVINGRDVSASERPQLERDAILAQACVGIAVTQDRHFVLANRHFEQIFGWGPGELLGQSGAVLWADEAEYAEVATHLTQPLQRGEPIELDRQARRKDGSTFLARVKGRAVNPEQPVDSGTVWIVEDVTERRQSERALAAARDAAEAANRAKSAFLANTSHELRTPLNGMIGLARLARDESTDGPRRHQYLDQIVDNAQSLAGILSDILDLSKIEAGKLQLETASFDLGALLQTLQRAYATLAEARGLTLTLRAPPAPPGPPLGMANGDALRLRQVLSSLLANAIRFTPSGGVVWSARRLGEGDGDATGATVRFEVQDSGPGITPEVQARLFRPFVQADQSTTREFGGAGLGLSICHELALLMGGRVGVHSAPGQGSTFWAELPLPAADDAPAGRPAAAVCDLQGARVLMVEDNVVNMMIAVAMLEQWGVRTAQATDGQEVLAAVQAAAAAGQPFDAVLMDVQMPRMSGYEATRALRAAGQRLPVIALTAAALVSERDEALCAGMDDFLTKPIDAEQLRATLARWCAGRSRRG